MDAIRDNNFTPKQIRGIDLVVKSMSKKYPYVKGWKFDEEYYDSQRTRVFKHLVKKYTCE